VKGAVPEPPQHDHEDLLEPKGPPTEGEDHPAGAQVEEGIVREAAAEIRVVGACGEEGVKRA